jgi:hypothetical protein
MEDISLLSTLPLDIYRILTGYLRKPTCHMYDFYSESHRLNVHVFEIIFSDNTVIIEIPISKSEFCMVDGSSHYKMYPPTWKTVEEEQGSVEYKLRWFVDGERFFMNVTADVKNKYFVVTLPHLNNHYPASAVIIDHYLFEQFKRWINAITSVTFLSGCNQSL